MTRVRCLRDVCWWMLSIIVCRASVVLEFGRVLLCFVRCCIIWLLMRVSRSFAMMGRSEIGR